MRITTFRLMLFLAGALVSIPFAASAQTAPPTATPVPCTGTNCASSNANASSQPVQQTQVAPLVNSSAAGTSVNTQINNTNLGMNSYAPGVQCASPQLAINSYTQGLRQGDAGFGSNSNSNGVNIGFVAPLGLRSQRACQALADEILHQRQLDTQLTMISKCGEFHKAGLVLNPVVFPELTKVCAGVTIAAVPAPSPAPVVMVPEASPPPEPQSPNAPPSPSPQPQAEKTLAACAPMSSAQKNALLRQLRIDAHRHVSKAQAKADGEVMQQLRAACVPDSAIFLGLNGDVPERDQRLVNGTKHTS